MKTTLQLLAEFAQYSMASSGTSQVNAYNYCTKSIQKSLMRLRASLLMQTMMRNASCHLYPIESIVT